jgi:predicted metalloprotease with PDZ domain
LQWKAKNGGTETPATATPAMVGIEISNQVGKAMVDKVLVGGAGAAAGIQVGDELIGWDGYRVTAEQWSDRLGLYRAGDRIAATLARRGKLLEVSVEIAPANPGSWNLQRADSPDEKQEMRWKSWLQIAEPPVETSASAPKNGVGP